MSSTKHFLQRELERNGSLDMRYHETQYLPNPRYPNQELQVEYYPNGTRVIPIDRRTGDRITVMTNTDGSLDGVAIGLRNHYNYPSSYDKNPNVPPAPNQKNSSL